MADRIISELFLFPSYKIIAFEGRAFYYTVKSTHVCYSQINKNADAVESDFSNKRIDVSNSKMLGKLSELTEEKCKRVFSEARYQDNKYPDFTNPDGEKLDSALDSIKSYLAAEKWSIAEDKTWIIIPKPAKKLTGKHIDVEFNLSPEGFKRGVYEKIMLPVYYDELKADTKEINYSVEVPDYIYDFLMLHPDMAERPKSKVFTTNIFTQIHGHLEDLSYRAVSLTDLDAELAKAKKVIVVKFSSGQRDIRDSMAFGYGGKETTINYNFLIGYKMPATFFNNGSGIYVDKKWEQGKGFVPIRGRNIPVSVSGKIIEWTQEREDFFTKIEVNFKTLSDNLNLYLKDLDADKVDTLILNGGELKLLQ